MNGYGAANTRSRQLRPLRPEVPLANTTPDEAAAQHDDYLWEFYEEELRQDRLLEHSGLNGMAGAPSVNVVAFPVAVETARAA